MVPDEESPIQKKAKKSKSIKEITQENLRDLFKASTTDEAKNILNEHVKNLDFRCKSELSKKVSSVVQERYLEFQGELLKQTLIEDFNKINEGLKYLQINTPITDIFINHFVQMFKHLVGEKKCEKTDFLFLWEKLPFRNLENFLAQLDLREEFKSQENHKFFSILKDLVGEQKLQQCCSYYLLSEKASAEFQDQLLIPKLLNSDQIFSPLILKVFKSRPRIKNAVIQNIDMAKAVTICEQLGEDPRNIEKLNTFILRKHYLSMVHQYKEWFIFEDKMSFNPLFLQWYCEQEESVSKIVRTSILIRNNLIEKNEQVKIVQNPLFEEDCFSVAEKILDKKNDEIESQYIHLKDYGIQETDVYFVDNSSSPIYNEMIQNLSTTQLLGFDAQNRCTSTKYEQQGVSLLQFSTRKKIYIVDFLKLENNENFINFFKGLLSNEKVKKIGHTVQSDIKYLQKTIKMENVHGFIDIVKLFKAKYPSETQNSLAYMAEKLVGKKISKFEQRSNWNRRPLKKTQTHYAALDAQICLQIYDILNEGQNKLFKVEQKKKIKKEEVIRNENLVYSKQYEELLTEKMPKFMIDNMLKKLSSVMRNLGIDAEYISVCDHSLIREMAEKEKRIILTRDWKLLQKRDPKTPIYCINAKGDCYDMFQEIKEFFKINLELYDPLSRCVKCNGDNLEEITKKEAMKFIEFKYEDTVEEFWRCTKCRQIYWEGKQFEKALNKYTNMQN